MNTEQQKRSPSSGTAGFDSTFSTKMEKREEEEEGQTQVLSSVPLHLLELLPQETSFSHSPFQRRDSRKKKMRKHSDNTKHYLFHSKGLTLVSMVLPTLLTTIGSTDAISIVNRHSLQTLKRSRPHAVIAPKSLDTNTQPILDIIKEARRLRKEKSVPGDSTNNNNTVPKSSLLAQPDNEDISFLPFPHSFASSSSWKNLFDEAQDEDLEQLTRDGLLFSCALQNNDASFLDRDIMSDMELHLQEQAAKVRKIAASSQRGRYLMSSSRKDEMSTFMSSSESSESLSLSSVATAVLTRESQSHNVLGAIHHDNQENDKDVGVPHASQYNVQKILLMGGNKGDSHVKNHNERRRRQQLRQTMNGNNTSKKFLHGSTHRDGGDNGGSHSKNNKRSNSRSSNHHQNNRSVAKDINGDTKDKHKVEFPRKEHVNRDSLRPTAAAAAAAMISNGNSDSVTKRASRQQNISKSNSNMSDAGVGYRISHDEEIELSRIIQRGVELHSIKSKFEEEHGRDITRQEWAELAKLESPKQLRRMVSDYRMAKNKLVMANMGLVHAVVRSKMGIISGSGKDKVLKSGISYEEMVQEGSLGLLRAAELFDPSRGLRFSTYATIWIKGMLSNSNISETIKVPLREKNKWNKIQSIISELQLEFGANDTKYKPTNEAIAERSGMDVDTVKDVMEKMKNTKNILSLDYQYETHSKSGGDVNSFEALQHDKNLMDDVDLVERLHVRTDVIAALVKNLDRREARLMCLRYGLNDGRTRSMKECAEEMGISKSRAQQLARGCLKKLREADDAESLHEYLLSIA
jgi:RNA polymerase sigma factor, sigma-70 family